jgi:hypothetical protein
MLKRVRAAGMFIPEAPVVQDARHAAATSPQKPRGPAGPAAPTSPHTTKSPASTSGKPRTVVQPLGATASAPQAATSPARLVASSPAQTRSAGKPAAAAKGSASLSPVVVPAVAAAGGSTDAPADDFGGADYPAQAAEAEAAIADRQWQPDGADSGEIEVDHALYDAQGAEQYGQATFRAAAGNNEWQGEYAAGGAATHGAPEPA